MSRKTVHKVVYSNNREDLLNKEFKNVMICGDLKIGDKVNNIQPGRICSTYPLYEFKNYKNQPRNNLIKEGIIIDKTPEFTLFDTIMVENNGNVCCVRIY